MLYLRSKEDSSKVEELRQLIFDEIDHRNRFIYCKSPNAEASRWVDEEIQYIKSKDRIFETIDIEQSETGIIEQLNDFRKKSNIFISYPRDDTELAKSIANRLKNTSLMFGLTLKIFEQVNHFIIRLQMHYSMPSIMVM